LDKAASCRNYFHSKLCPFVSFREWAF